MTLKKLVDHGNSKALIISSSTLKAAGLDGNTLFQITSSPSTGITIQSVEDCSEAFDESKEHVLEKYSKLFKRLSKK